MILWAMSFDLLQLTWKVLLRIGALHAVYHVDLFHEWLRNVVYLCVADPLHVTGVSTCLRWFLKHSKNTHSHFIRGNVCVCLRGGVLSDFRGNIVGRFLTSLFVLRQPTRCLRHRPAEWSTCMGMTALRRAPAASSLTARWRRLSSVSTDTAMPSSSLSLYLVSMKPSVCLSHCKTL